MTGRSSAHHALPRPGLIRAAGILVRSRMDRMLLAEALDDLGFVSHDLGDADGTRGAWGAVDILLVDEPSAALSTEAVARAKERADPTFLPALVVVPRVGSAERWLRSGFDDVIRLPIPREELLGRLRLHLRLRERTLEAERAVFDRLPLGLFRANGQGDILTANPAMARLLGFADPSELQAAGPIFEGFQLPDLQDLLRRAREGDGAVNGLELPWIRPDGTLVWLRWTGRIHTDDRGKVILAEGAAEDVTVQRRTLAELESSRVLNAATIDSLGANLAILDPAGRILSVNRAWRTFSEEGGLDPILDAGVGQSYLEVCRNAVGPGSEQARIAAEGIIQVLSAKQEVYELEYTMELPDLHWFRMRVTPMRVADGPRGAVVTHLDITAQRRAEESLRTREQELRQAQKMEAVGRLAGGIAHDFNNLLTAIRGNTQLIRDGLAPADPVRAELTEIEDAAERAGALTRQLLVLSRHQVQSIRDVELSRLINDTLQLLCRVIREDIALEVLEPTEPLVVRADPGNLEMILLNLAVNARDAMPGGGRLILRAFREEDRGGAGRSENVVATAVLEIEDTGEGMTEEVREKVFEPFFTTKEEGQGSGLGLSIVHGIVEQMGGRIEIRSVPGKGTLVRIHLPLVTAPSPPFVPSLGGPSEDGPDDVSGSEPLQGEPTADSDPPRSGRSRYDGRPPGAQPGETILLVEDDLQVRRPIERLLSRLGYRVLEAEDGAAGLELLLEQEGISLVLSDVVMPRMTGPAMIRRLREIRTEQGATDPGLRILFISGYTEREVGFFQEGSDGPPPRLLQKPFDLQILARAIREVLDE